MVSVDAAIKRIEKRLEEENRRQEDLFIAKRIEELKKKKRREDTEMKKRLEAIRKEIFREETPPQKTVRKEIPSPPGTTSVSPRRISRENFERRYKEYYNKVHEMVQSRWTYPVTPSDDFELIVSIRLDRSGRVIKSWIEKSSGNRLFDESLLMAIQKASPFPPLPEGLKDETYDIGFRFCPGGCVD